MSAEDERRKAPKRFLRKGEGTARFGIQNRHVAAAASPAAFHLPRFTPTSSLPLSARTVDSGISNEDETRPPTTASLPIDRPSAEKTRPRVEEDHEEEEEPEEVEEPSPLLEGPTFVPDATSMVSPNGSDRSRAATEMSEEAARFRAYAEHAQEAARHIQMMNSVSTPTQSTPSEYDSELSGPLGASTPIHHSNGPPPTQQQQQAVPTVPTLVGLSSSATSVMPSSSSSLSATPHETPPARPLFPSNRAARVVSAAQTGASLVLREEPRHLLRQRQKENRRPNVSEHHYDEPIRNVNLSMPANRRHHPSPRKDPEVENLKVQLRDALAHVDYAEAQLYTTARSLKEHFERRRDELAEQFEAKSAQLDEEHRDKSDRLERERRELERNRAIFNRGVGERQREQEKTIDELRGKLKDSETQASKFRLEIRKRDERLKEKEEEIGKLRAENERAKKNTTILEKQVRQMRNEKERERREEEHRIKAIVNRTAPAAHHHRTPSAGSASSTISSAAGASTLRRHVSSAASSAQRGRSVSWADEPPIDETTRQETTLETSATVDPRLEMTVMRPSERLDGPDGQSVIYRDALGESTSVKVTPENGRLFEYSNGDRMWASAAQSVLWYQYAVDGTIVILMRDAQIRLVYHKQRQLEIIRPNNNVTLLSVRREDIRTELVCDPATGRFSSELFKRSEGRVVRRGQGDRAERFGVYKPGEMCTMRDNEKRYVLIRTFVDFELVEPEFRLRWMQTDGGVPAFVMKVFGRAATDEKTQRVQLDLQTGAGAWEAVEEVTSGTVRKTAIFKW